MRGSQLGPQSIDIGPPLGTNLEIDASPPAIGLDPHTDGLFSSCLQDSPAAGMRHLDSTTLGPTTTLGPSVVSPDGEPNVKQGRDTLTYLFLLPV